MSVRVGPAGFQRGAARFASRQPANRRALAAAASMLILSLTGCGSGGGDPQVATAVTATRPGPASAGARTSGNDVAAYIESMRDWVKCLREQGIEASDPDATGTVTFPGNAGGQKTDAKFVAAQNKCRSLHPAVPESVTEMRKPKLTSEQIKVMRKYANCMQENGAPDYPDPGPDGYISRQQKWDRTSPGAQRATRACAGIIGDPAHPSATRG
jgi:hypothetical protein